MYLGANYVGKPAFAHLARESAAFPRWKFAISLCMALRRVFNANKNYPHLRPQAAALLYYIPNKCTHVSRVLFWRDCQLVRDDVADFIRVTP